MAGSSLDDQEDTSFSYDALKHKKSKKKKKKKEKDYEKRDKKKKHRKDKKKKYHKESSHDDVKLIDTENNGTESRSRSPSSLFPSSQEDKKDGHHGLKSKSEKTALQRLLEYVHQAIEKKDTQQFFAWPVTDQIAPGYSLIISHPMDLNSMKRNIENNIYSSLPQYIEDLQLMCKNAMVYNRPETVYFKAAKKLLHHGLKLITADKLRSQQSALPFLSELTSEQLGFDLNPSAEQSESEENMQLIAKPEQMIVEEPKIKSEVIGVDGSKPEDAAPSDENDSQTPMEITKDEYDPEEILAQARLAAEEVAEKLAQKKPAMEMGFLRQKEDGTTTLAIIVPNDGIDPKTKERPVSLGSLIGKLSHGSGNVQGFREDKRNFVKPVKPLYYGAFGSYAPSYDSTFANLTKEESQLLFQTYGDETAVHYAESVLNFSKDCDYVTTMVDNLLDIMTGGDHRKTKKLLEEKKKIREDEEMEEKRLKGLLESKKPSTSLSTCAPLTSSTNGTPLFVQTMNSSIKSATVSPVSAGISKSVAEDLKIEMNQLKSLSELGIDTSFIDYYENVSKEEQKLTDKLEQTRSLLEKLNQTQHERLSAPLPLHLSQIASPSENEHALADKVTENLTTIIKKVTPTNVAPVAGVRKAMGIAPVTPQQVCQNTFTSQFNFPQPNNTEESNSLIFNNFPMNVNSKNNEDEALSHVNSNSSTAVTGFDLESELREFLESDPALSSFHLPDDVDDADKTIEQMLSAHS